MSTPVLAVGNSVLFELTVTNQVLDTAVNDATVVVEVLKPDESILLSSTPLSYVSGTDGIYRVTVPPIAGLTAGIVYTVIFNAENSDPLEGEWICKVKATSGK